LDPLHRVNDLQRLKPVGDPSTLEIDSRELVRADFVKPLNEKLTMHQSTLVRCRRARSSRLLSSRVVRMRSTT